MEKASSSNNYVLAINTPLQKKNDKNIQNFLNKYKYYEERPEFEKNTGDDFDLIISHKSTIPDLVIYNKVFNKNDCFIEANEKENNYFPRQCFYIKFEKNEKSQSKGENNPKTEENMINEENKKGEEAEEESELDDELEEEEDDEVDNDEQNKEINDKNESLNKMNDFSLIENNSIISNNNSMYKDIDFQPGTINLDKSNLLQSPNLFNQSRMNFIDNSVNYDELSSFDSNIINNIKNIIENKNDDNTSQLSFYPKNYPKNNQNNFNNINNSSNNPESTSIGLNKIQNMFINQNEIQFQIEKQKNNNDINVLKFLEEKIIKLLIFDPFGNIIEKKMNIFEAFEYITMKVIKRNKELEKYNVYIVDTEEKIEGTFFYMSLFTFLKKILN